MTISIPAVSLARLINLCLPHTGPDFMLPIFRSVHLFEQGGKLCAEATDRFTMMRARSTADAPDGLSVMLDRDDCKAIASAFKARRGSGLLLSLDIDGDRLAVSIAEGVVAVGLDLRLTVQCQEGVFPVLGGLYDNVADAKPADWLPTIAGEYLRRMPREQAQIRYSTASKPVGFYGWSEESGPGDWAALIMPRRMPAVDVSQSWATTPSAPEAVSA